MIKSLYLTFLLIVQIGISLAQTPGFEWVYTYGGPNIDRGRAVATDNQNNVYVSGTYTDTIDFDPGPGVTNQYTPFENAFIQKLDANGNLAWVKTFPDGSATVSSITVDPSNDIILAGYFYGGFLLPTLSGTDTLYAPNSGTFLFVIKMNAAGDFIWGRAFGGGGGLDEINDVQTDDLGNIYTTGHFYGASDFDPGTGSEILSSAAGSMDIFIHKLSASGNFVWAKKIGSGATDDGVSLDVYGTTMMLTGWFQLNVDFDPASGSNIILSAQDTDMYLLSFSTNGNFNWVKSFGSAAPDKGAEVRFDTNGQLYLTGSFGATMDLDPGTATYTATANEGTNFFILKLSETYDFIWAKTFTGTDYKFSRSMALCPNNGVVLTGEFKGMTDFDCGPGANNLYAMGESDMFIIYLDQNGNYRWAGSFGNSLNQNTDVAQDITVDSQGNIYTVGWYATTVDFDCGPGVAIPPFSGYSDIFIQKLNSNVLTVNENNLTNLKLYPNPSNQYLSISGEGLSNCRVTICNSLGMIVMEKELSGSDAQLDIQSLSAGSYVVNVSGEYGSQYQTFIKTAH